MTTSCSTISADGRSALAAVLVMIFSICFFAGCRAARREDAQRDDVLPRSVFSGNTMGTSWRVVVSHHNGISGSYREWAEDLRQKIEDELNRVNRMMSAFDPESELSRFNRHKSTEPFPVSPETAYVFYLARRISKKTLGAFDITVGSLVNAWGFGTNGRSEVPSGEDLAVLRDAVGYELYEVDLKSNTIRKHDSSVNCTLAGIAKGYGVDRLARVLDEHGCKDYLVDIGGELRARGRNPNGRTWRVGIERPMVGRREVELVVPLENFSLATSGDYRNFYKADSKILSHTIDPRSGLPKTQRLLSATVLHEECAAADAFATAMMVLEPEEAKKLALALDLSVLLLVREDSGEFIRIMTPGFKKRLPRKTSAKNGRPAGPGSLIFTIIAAILFVGIGMFGLGLRKLVSGRDLHCGCTHKKGSDHTCCMRHEESSEN